MKFLTPQIAYLLNQQEARRNLKALLKYLAFLAGTVLVYSVLFHVMMLHEGQHHTWFTGLYWTLTVMSTLGFGDITFHTDLGRLFSITVLLSGIVLLLIVLPFAFIRFFYAPWLEAQLHGRAPTRIDADVNDHVIICRYDALSRG
ncbi:MAG: potassium channel family protein, partial [Myxococcales bacterium]|nr:potassium channel family protein [Myxococcales bacterium]